MKARTRHTGIARIDAGGWAERDQRDSSRIRSVAYGLSWLIAALMVVSSVAGLSMDGLYRDGSWAREALRGGDLAALALVVPVLIWSLLLSTRGSLRAQAAWVGALAYGVYNYAYYVFGAAFNDVFLLHIALMTLSMWATALAAASIDVRRVAASIGSGRAVRWLGAFLVLVGVILGGLWVVLAVRFAITGELMADIPADGIHLVFAIDLSLLVPALVVAGVLLWRRTEVGIVAGAVMAVMGGLYQVNMLLAGVFQANADVPGVKPFPPEGIVVASGFALACVDIFGGRPSRGQRIDHAGRR